MAGDVTTGYSKHFGDNVTMLAQQRYSRLRRAVDVESGLVGEEAFFDQVGETSGQEVTTRYGDSPNNDVGEYRRRVAPTKYDWGKLYDTFGSLDLPALPAGLSWDTSELYSTGTVAVVPEPTVLALLCIGGCLLLRKRRRR